MPEMFCFGRFQLDDPDCAACPQWQSCADKSAGWGMGGFLADAAKTIELEKLFREIPDWVFEWDNLPEKELLTMAREQPERFHIYEQFNAGINDS